MQGHLLDPHSEETEISVNVSNLHAVKALSSLSTTVISLQGAPTFALGIFQQFYFYTVVNILSFDYTAYTFVVMDTFTAYPVLKSFLAGSFSGTFSTILFQPLDLVKTRLQSTVNTQITTQRNGMLRTLFQIAQKENISGLWRGMTPSITRVIPGVGLYFSSLHWLKHTFCPEEPMSPLQAVVLGITARSMSGGLLIPITVVKTRFESGVYKYNNMSEALKLIYKYEGVRGLSSGLGPTLLRDAPYSGLYLMFYTLLKDAAATSLCCPMKSVPIHFACGITAGVLASAITHPADVVKTKMQLYPSEFKNAYNAFTFVYNKYGVFGYFKGIVPRMLRRTLMTTMAWTVYEQITRTIGLK